MRAVVYRRNGKPAEVLEVSNVDAPPPLGAGEVLIRVQARPIHHGDLLGIAGRYRSPGDMTPLAEGGNRVGFEGAGVVEAAGEGVDLAPGTRVAFFPGRGAWSERVTVRTEFVTRIPDGVSDDIAAQLHVNPLTAALLLRAAQSAGAGPDKGVVVLTAAGSAVAKLAAAMAVRAGLRVVAVVRSAAGAAELARLQPDVPVVSTDGHDWQAQLHAATDGRPIQVVLDAVGGALASQMLTMLSSGGTLISYGDLSGEPITANALAFSTRDIRISGVTVGTWAGLSPEQRAEDIAQALDMAYEKPGLFPVASRYELTDVLAAAADVERPGKAGVVLLTS